MAPSLQYLQLYTKSELSTIELLSEPFYDPWRDRKVENLVVTMWKFSFEKIRRYDVFAGDILSAMACLDGTGIPKTLLPQAESSLKLAKSLGLLKAYSLITANKEGSVFDMRRLVYLATRSWLRSHGKFAYWAESSLLSVLEQFPSGEYGTLDTCELYLPNAEAVLGHDQLSLANAAPRASLAHKASRYFQNRGRYNAAQRLAEKAVDWTRREYGEQDSRIILSPYTNG